MDTLNAFLAAGAKWYTDLKSAVDTIKGVWAGVATIAASHPELEDDVHETFVDVINGLRSKSPTAVLTVLSDVRKAYTDFTVAYTGEKATLVALLDKLRALAN